MSIDVPRCGTCSRNLRRCEIGVINGLKQQFDALCIYSASITIVVISNAIDVCKNRHRFSCTEKITKTATGLGGNQLSTESVDFARPRSAAQTDYQKFPASISDVDYSVCLVRKACFR
jgi:hypothetical protein